MRLITALALCLTAATGELDKINSLFVLIRIKYKNDLHE